MPKLKISSCTVTLLDGADIIIEVDKLKSSEDLINEVCKSVGIDERIYFGLKYAYPKDDKDYWLDINKPLLKQLKYASNKFKFAVQFFPKSFQSLNNEITRYQFVLQIREYLLTGVWSCTIPTQSLLASYIVQSEFGDYDADQHDASYLNELQFMPDQVDGFLGNVAKFHKKHTGLSPMDIDWLYLETARKTPLYGMEVFDIMDCDGNPMKLGVNVDGINILHMNTNLHTFLWPTVLKCRFQKNEIIIQLKGNNELMTVAFVAGTMYDAKRIMKCCNVYKHFASHGKRLIVNKKKKPSKNSESVECKHNTKDDTFDDFKRVDSKRFSKRFIKVKESTRLDLPDDDDEDETPHKLNINGTAKEASPKKSPTNEMVVPVITRTAPSDQSLSSSNQSNGDFTLQEGEENLAGDEDAPKPTVEIIEIVDIEYTKGAGTGVEDGTNDTSEDGGVKDLNETVTSKIVEIQIVTSTEESIEIRKDSIAKEIPKQEEKPPSESNEVNTEYGGQADEVVVIYGDESLDEIETSLKSNTSLMEEIEKELNESYEIVINEEEDGNEDSNTAATE